MKKIEYFDDRFYWHEEEERFVASVTTIDNYTLNKPQLNRWRADLGNELADLRMTLASQSGSKIHAYLEAFVKGDEIKFERDKVTQEEWLKVWRGVQIIEELNPQILTVEKTVFGDRYAGTVDLTLRVEDGDYMINGTRPLHLERGFYIADWKSGNYVGDSALRQVSAYAIAQEKIGIKVTGALIFHLSAKTKCGFKTVFINREEIEKYYADFTAIKDVFYRLYPTLSAKELEIPSKFQLTLNDGDNAQERKNNE